MNDTGLLFSRQSAYAQERVKWEAFPTEYGPGLKPYVHVEYPRAMFRFGHPPGRIGAIELLETRDAHSDAERSDYEARGFRASQEEAIAHVQAIDLELKKAAAEREAADRKMSEKAYAEAKAFDETTMAHVGEIPCAAAKTGKRDTE